ncbi:Non-selective Cation Channel-2 (NSCC2) Family protein [Blastocystis sp. ATCC 50177/Nand II]|uniref:Translocation protein SEC62 n=1 Tax=Blastocystis sp. subtype 1 (strain ATCC 50177 / NandII) TaxID=478820 RepID=A0A196SAQ6_BLAHN|nr:Non-selective Cation Channel-2 (NSCC2) Family protein [Blastocystis sp. ATCC 50177/Nand II]
MSADENPLAALNDYLSTEENVMRVADALFGSKGVTKYDVVEIIYTDDGEYKKHSKCSKGKHIDAWFMQQENRDRAKLPAIPEDQMEKAIEVIMDCLMENKLMHTAKKPDNARRIIKENNLVWDKKYVYSWDYDGPAGMRYLKTALTLIAIIAIPTYRIWPRFLQNIVFYTSIVLLVAMIALEVVRFLIFLVCYLFGYRIWIFPDLDRDDKGIFGVFYPLISVEKIEDGYNKYRWITLGVIGAVIAVYAYNPKGFVRGCITVYNAGYQTVQWTRSEWISLKLATIELMKRIITPKSKVEVEKRGPKPPVYDPEEDALYDFEEADDVVDEVDMDDLDDVKLDIE